MTRSTRLLLTASISALALSSVFAAAAQAAPKGESNAALQQKVVAQQARIDALEKRLLAIEARESAPSPAVQDSAAQAQANAAAIDAQTIELQTVQAQLAQLQDNTADSVKVTWKNGGPQIASADGFFTFHPRGRAQFDYSTTSGSNYDLRNISGTQAASLRLGAEGTMGRLGYKVEADFADETVSMKDAYISYSSSLFGQKVEYYLGNKLNDRSIDGSTSGLSLPFMERNVVATVVAPQKGFFGVGLMSKVYGDNWHASLAVTGAPLSNAGTERSPLTIAGRAHWNPVKTKAGFIHLGVWGFTEELDPSTTAINKTSYIAATFNDNLKVSASSLVNPERDTGYGYEIGGTWGSFWAFGEYGERNITLAAAPSVKQRAGSVYAGYLLTGEKPGFSTRSGMWSGVKVARPLNGGGLGAFELAVRYDDIDFTDTARGGDGQAVTVGVNWYLNDWSRVMVNYQNWKTNNLVGNFKGADEGDTVSVRGEVAF